MRGRLGGGRCLLLFRLPEVNKWSEVKVGDGSGLTIACEHILSMSFISCFPGFIGQFVDFS